MRDDCQYLIPLLSSVATGAVAFLGVVLTNRSNLSRIKLENELEAKRKQTELHRDRGEELYAAADKWIKGFGLNGLSLIAVMRGKITYNQYLDLRIKTEEKPNYDFSRLEMIIDVYFPETRLAYDQVIQAREAANEIAAAHKREYEIGNIDGIAFLKPFMNAQNQFAAAGELLKVEIKKCLLAV